MKTIYASEAQVIPLGRQGEDRAARVLFDLSALKKDYGEGGAVLTLTRAGEGERWLLLPDREEDMALWVVSGHWTRFAGYGSCQLSWYVDGALAKSVTYQTRVEPALDTHGADIDPDLDFLAQVQQAAGRAALAARKAEKVELGLVCQPTVKNGTWWVWDQQGEGYRDTGVQAEGPAGVSPRVEASVAGQDIGFTVTDASGSRSYTFGAAPAGYGLGTAGKLTQDWNGAVLSGFYYGNTNGPDSGWWCGVVCGNGDGYAFQHLYETATRVQAVREMSGGIWGPWEYVNPLLTPGTEYRTTQRFLGKSVYVRTVDCGALPGSDTKTVSAVGISAQHVVRACGCSVGTHGIIIAVPSPDISMLVQTATGNLVVNLYNQGADVSSVYTQTYVTVWYTKSTD